jgi:hypothetical protein
MVQVQALVNFYFMQTITEHKNKFLRNSFKAFLGHNWPLKISAPNKNTPVGN